MKAADVVASIRRHYGAERDGLGPEWAVLEEFTLQPGAGYQRADMFIVRAWRGLPKGHERHTIEVKVSRSDLRAELAKPGKSAPFDEVSHRFWLATPHGLVTDLAELPAHWGLYEISPGGRVKKTRQATRKNDPAPLPEGALIEAFRRASRAETRIRTADENDAAAQVVELQRRLAAAERSLHTARRAADRDKSALRSYLAEVALAGGWLCVCGERIKKTKYTVEHADGTPCPEAAWGGRAQIDLEGLAERLGIADPDQTDDGADDLDAPGQAVAVG
jgi:hypothetical protein